MWAFEALRIARGEPRLGLDTDHRTIPNEVGWIGTAVHLDKGCYRGQETVARVHTLGQAAAPADAAAPGRLRQPAARTRGATCVLGEKVGRVRRHQRPPPRARADRAGLVKRNVPLDATLVADGLAAAQEVVVDPEVGLHVRPTLR